MRCACPACGAFMPQAENAARCVCPDCGQVCTACLGGNSQPLSLAAILQQAELLQEKLQQAAQGDADSLETE